MKFKLFALVSLLTSLFSCSCSFLPHKVPAAADTQAMLASTVQILVQVEGALLGPEDALGVPQGELPVSQGWAGSGVVYKKDLGLTGPVHSLILTANHVLETPDVGTVVMTGMGRVRVDRVEISVRTSDGRICSLQTLVLGDWSTGDVATGEADCDAGRVAPIARRSPQKGARIYVVGHPLAINLAIITEGLTSGWFDGYMLVGAAAAPGNSGGPCFNADGEVIGLLVRGSPRYSHISLVTPLSSVLARIAETVELD